VAARVLKPVLLAALLAAFVALLVLPAAAEPAGASTRASLARLDTGILDELNAIRLLHGLAPLRMDSALTAAAGAHSREMGVRGYFQHTSADGVAFWRRIERWYGSSGYAHWAVGENLLWASPAVDPNQAVRLWMRSPEHRANILDPVWRQIGIAAVHLAAAPGLYAGAPVTIVTTDFGARQRR
jgi:uncharacterized protein YkwD